jgi:hypothetical protein
MRVLVNGVGNIGTTLLQVLTTHRSLLGLEEIYAHKATVHPWDQAQLRRLKGLGVVLVGEHGSMPLEAVCDEIDYVFDTGRPGGGVARQASYDGWRGLRGGSAQGTEHAFGTPYVHGLGLPVDRWTHIPSCNTHSALAILHTLADGDLDEVVSADFVVARRSEDIGNHERLVAGNVVARHLDPELGTHHAIDADAVLRRIGRRIPMQSSDITTPSQFLHATRFTVRLRTEVSADAVQARIERNPLVGTTRIFESNKVFEIGRRFGLGGRLYNQAIFVAENLLVSGDEVRGWVVVPQEGNTILSTVGAFLEWTQPGRRDVMDELADRLLIRDL